jgi:hypothetical protein
MDVVRLPIAFKGLGRLLLLHEEDAFEPYTLTIPDFDLVTEHVIINRSVGCPRNARIQRGRKGRKPTHPTAT